MQFANPIVAAGVGGLSVLFETRAVTPVEACEAYLSRIRGLDTALGAYVDVDEAGARAAAHASAERWGRGAPLSPIDGVPIAVKANIAVEGLPWTAGIDAYRDRRAHADATAVARLRAAGAVILGATNMHEGAFGVLTDNAWFGRTQNPWKHGHTAGGSSGGSASAVAAGLCAAALGTDTLGSVRIPSSFCGCVGHKPTQGLIPTDGVIALSWTLDHVGVHARSADDAAKLLAAACGAEAELASEIAEPAPVERLREGAVARLVWDGQVEADPAVAAAVARAVADARAAGIEVEPVRLEIDYDELVRLAALVCAAESLVEHQDMLLAVPGRFSPMLQERLDFGRRASAADLAGAYRTLAGCAEAVREALTPYTALIAPTTPHAAFAFDEEESWTVPFFTGLANVTGLPATAVPVGVANGRPLSAQVLAWDDETSLGLARLIAHDIGAPENYRG
jgi:aspartyl-tRNA(Asn)/glutamyl-tRNA(Gln) amidotransferase subunit A